MTMNKTLHPTDDIDYMSQEKKATEDAPTFKIVSMHRYEDFKIT